MAQKTGDSFAAPQSGLGFTWGLVIGGLVAAGGLLAVLGPSHGSIAHPAAVQRVSGSVARPAAPVSVLLARFEEQIAGGSPPGPRAAETLAQIHAALPHAAAADREHASELASDLFDRAQGALAAGNVNEEQQWLALGSLIAPPPDIAPQPASEFADAAPAGRLDITPNEAEADPMPAGQPAAQPAPARPEPKPPIAQARSMAPSPALRPPAFVPAGADRPVTVAERPGGRGEPYRSTFDSVAGGQDGLLGGDRVVVHYAASDGGAASAADRIAATLLTRAGTVEIRSVGAAPRHGAIRYFFDHDEPAARALQKLLGGADRWPARAFTAYQPKPRPGTLEVWLAEG